MKSLEEALEAWEICHDNARDCPDCPYKDKELVSYTIDNCRNAIFHDVYNIAIKLKQENKRLKYSKNIYEETMVFFSDANMELLGDMKALKEENNKLKEEGKKLIIEMYRMDQYK